MAIQVLDFTSIEVRNAASGRRKLGVLGGQDGSENASLNSLALTEPLPVTEGGTGLGEVSKGDLLVAIADNVLAKLPASVMGYLLTSMGPGQVPAYRPLNITINDLAGIVPKDFFGHLVINDGLTVTTDGGAPVWCI